jgi:hypothetical protein
VDMRRHLKRRMNNRDLEQVGGEYIGVVANVVEEQMWNRFLKERKDQPVLLFADGWGIVPNMGMRRTLIEALGPKSDDWIGGRVRIFLRPMARKHGGDGPQRFEKAVECLAPQTANPPATEREELAAAEISWG